MTAAEMMDKQALQIQVKRTHDNHFSSFHRDYVYELVDSLKAQSDRLTYTDFAAIMVYIGKVFSEVRLRINANLKSGHTANSFFRLLMLEWRNGALLHF